MSRLQSLGLAAGAAVVVYKLARRLPSVGELTGGTSAE
jgi:hypothetical protein